MQIANIDNDRTLIQNVKKRFFALRNGILADTLRKSGSPYRIIFGLNLPQLNEIANAFGYNKELANELWQNKNTRESRLLAPMLVAPDNIRVEEVKEWISDLAGSTEEADVLCHSLLRKTSFVEQLIDELITSHDDNKRYVAFRLAFALINKDSDKIRVFAENELRKNNDKTRGIAKHLLQEIDFLNEEC